MTLPLPDHYDPARVAEVFRVPYEERARQARAYARAHDVPRASRDEPRVGLLLIDVQNTFCIPGFELFVAGRSGNAAVDDNRRLCEFLYRNLDRITGIHATLDTHSATQIFHSAGVCDEHGEPLEPMTTVSLEDVTSGHVRASAAAVRLGLDQSHLEHYCRKLSDGGKYELLVWPYHAMLGGIGHALVASVEEAVFFHDLARGAQADLEIKGRDPRTENYSALRPEVDQDQHGRRLGEPNLALVDELLGYDALVVAGQAQSHCVAWTLTDLITAAERRDPSLASRVYLLEDCTSPVVVPGVVDFTEPAREHIRALELRGLKLARSTEPLASWDGFPVPAPKESL